MTSLDTLARSSAAAVHEAVAEVTPPVAPVVAPPVAFLKTATYALAGAAAAVAVLITLVLATPDEIDDVSTETTVAPTPTTEVPSITVPDVEQQVTTTVQSAPEAATPPPPAPPEPSNSPATTLPADTEPPLLVVTSPPDGARVEASVVTFSGKTEPGASVVASGKFSVAVSADGTWSVDLVVAPGANGVVFVATDDAGNSSDVRMTVHREVEAPTEPPKDTPKDQPKDQPKEEPKETTTTTTTTEGVSWSFTAWQTYGSCSELVPYDVFGGTAKPHSTVAITSSYGSGSTTADADGNWSVRVDFPSAPYDKTFPVKVKDEFGNKKYFDFVSLYTG